MKIAVISDIHSNLYALRQVLKEIGKLDIICCGDLVGYNPFPNEVVEMVRELEIPCVLGNHDHATITGNTTWFNPYAARAIEWTRSELSEENMEFLKTLPMVYEDMVYMVHGSPENQLEEYVFPDYPERILNRFFDYTEKDIMILGHTHVPFSLKIDNRLIFNPGAVGQPRDGNPMASFAVLDTGLKEVEFKRVEYDIDKVAREITEKGLPEFLAHRLYQGR